MKKSFYLCLPLLFFFLLSCEKDDITSVPDPDITEIAMLQASTVSEPQEISVTIFKGTPCHQVVETKKTISGNTFNYDIILSEGEEGTSCITVVDSETLTVSFDPPTSGDYTLNFLINGKIYETRTITVTE